MITLHLVNVFVTFLITTLQLRPTLSFEEKSSATKILLGNATESLATADLVLIGERDGKKFYVANAAASWMDSMEFCHNKNLGLAATLSQSELDFVGLKLRQRKGNFLLHPLEVGRGTITNGQTHLLIFYEWREDWRFPWFWTCGNDFFTEGTYRWMSNGYLINPRFLTSKFSTGPANNRNCVQISIRPSDLNVLFDFNCEDKTALPLCQGR